MNTERDYSKLPKWAQNEIGTLKRQVAEANRRIAELQGSIEGARVRWSTGTRNDGLALPDHATIEWQLGKGQVIRAHMQEDGTFVGKPTIRIDCTHQLNMHPAAANVIYVREGRWDEYR